MQTVHINLANCKTYDQIHQLLKEQLDFPSFYGENLDALWDCLTGFIETPVKVVFHGLDALSGDMRDEAIEIISIFNDAEKEGWGIYVETV